MLLGAGILHSGGRLWHQGVWEEEEVGWTPPPPPRSMHHSPVPQILAGWRQTEHLDDTRTAGNMTTSCYQGVWAVVPKIAGGCLRSYCNARRSRREEIGAFRGCLSWAKFPRYSTMKASTAPALRPGSSPGARVGGSDQALRGWP